MCRPRHLRGIPGAGGEPQAHRGSARAAAGAGRRAGLSAECTRLSAAGTNTPRAFTHTQALSAAHTYLFEERERLLALQAENDGLRLQECEDRARIKQILSLTRPADQRAAHGRGGNENGRPTTSALPRGAAPNRSKSPTAAALQQSQRVLRTLYLPAAHADAAALRCEALEAQLAEQKRFAAEHVAALKQDREIRERDAAGHAAALGAAAEELAERLRRAEEALRLTTRDFILAKQQRDAAEASAAAARDEAAAERRRAHQAADAAATAAEAALQQQRQELEAEGRAATEELAAQLAQREEELRKFETLHTLIRGQLEVRAQEAEQRAARATELARQSQQRRAHEMEGWAADVGQLRRRIGAIDRALRQQALLQRMPDGDARDAALARHARWAGRPGIWLSRPAYACGALSLPLLLTAGPFAAAPRPQAGQSEPGV